MKIIPTNVNSSLILVDDSDYRLASKFTWCIAERARTLYAQSQKDGVHFFLHNLLVPKVPTNLQLDHIDRNGLNNQRANLRLVTRTIQNLNREKKFLKELPTGVFKNGSRFMARCQTTYLGTFNTSEIASNVYETYKQKLVDKLLEEIIANQLEITEM